ncbi:YciI family protein [Streptomyces sp. NBC_00638]|uniref:YciI family protein n=1 Tax=unclassified Streptomyces TaxID=2593676 RepID=UPI00225C184B|nr:YciI family protein [Streptomyces sp. NBC_00638]MCX5009015.1 YciI family protein [Streptomyces sp. NBC_00638]
MAQYAILIYAKAHVDEAEVVPGAREAHDRHFQDMVKSEALVAAFALQPAADTATSIHGDVVTDGPFIDAKEVIAGFAIVEAPDLDAALKIARANPATQQGGGVEVRPVEGGFISDRPATA